jgi:acyl carrier protein
MSRPMTKDDIRDRMIELVANALASSPQAIRSDMLFSKLGLDSVAVVDIARQLEMWLQLEIDPTVAWDYPTIDAMAVYLEEQSQVQASTD